jgi:deoxyadenosine/deoxycytidine kinase
MNNNDKKWFLVEGNIGSGKTTLLEKLSNKDIFEVIREPVDLWLNTKGSDGKNLLQEFYEEPNRYAYLFQTIVFKTRLMSLDKEQEKPFRFSERSIWTDKYVFGKSCIDSNKMNTLEVNCYNQWFNWLEQKHWKQPDGIIYLRTSPDKCMERMNKRGRNEEASVPIEYLNEIHNYHEDWLNNWFSTPKIIIDNDDDDNWDNILKQVYTFINYNAQMPNIYYDLSTKKASPSYI